MIRSRFRRTLPALAVLAACSATAADLPQLGKSPTKDVVAAMTREEKVALVVGAGMRRPGAPADRQGPVVGETAKGVPGAAGTTVPISRLGIPAIVVADGPAGLRIQPKREGDTRTFYATIAEEQKRQPAPARPFMPKPPVPERVPSPDEIARAAREAEVGLFTLGRNSGEFRDRVREGDFELTAVEKTLSRDLATAFHVQKKKLVVVLNIGGVIETASWRDVPDAILLAWQPRQESGHAIADVLAGKTPPSGRLATTFPIRWEDVPSSANFPGKVLEGPDPSAQQGPFRGDRAAEVEYTDDVFVGYRHYATKDVKTAFPFGFGLSYTRFECTGLKLSSAELREELKASVTVRNAGSTPGREVVQLYVSAPGKSMPKPALELRAFAKTKTLSPGESETLTFTLTARDLASFDQALSSWRVEAGTYTVRVGASVEDIRRTATFTKATDERVASVSTAVGPTR